MHAHKLVFLSEVSEDGKVGQAGGMLLPMGRRVLYLFTEGAKKQHRLAHQLWLINFGAKTLPFGQNNHCHTFNLAVCVCVRDKEGMWRCCNELVVRVD